LPNKQPIRCNKDTQSKPSKSILYRLLASTIEKAAAQLASEASMMTVLRHKNIVKIRGIASSGADAYYETGRHDAYFIITGEALCLAKNDLSCMYFESNI
jgi:hypothetical protein